MLRQARQAASAKPTANMSTPSAAPAGSDFSHREIAATAHVSHGTIRAILTRATTGTNNGRADEPQHVDSEPHELAA